MYGMEINGGFCSSNVFKSFQIFTSTSYTLKWINLCIWKRLLISIYTRGFFYRKYSKATISLEQVWKIIEETNIIGINNAHLWSYRMRIIKNQELTSLCCSQFCVQIPFRFSLEPLWENFLTIHFRPHVHFGLFSCV